MEMVEVSLGMINGIFHFHDPSTLTISLPGWIKYWFPEFELTWLGVRAVLKSNPTYLTGCL